MALATLLTGCAHGSVMTAALGPQFGFDGEAGVVVSIEYTRLMHERPKAPPTNPEAFERRGSGNLLGLGFSGITNGGWVSETGAFASAALGVDYIPFLSPATLVHLGGAVGYEVRDGGHGVVGLLPRLGFLVAPWDVGHARWGLGLRLHCQVGGVNTCGPAATIGRLRLGD